MESGQSQFAALKRRSLALVPSSGARCAPTNSTYGSSTARLFPPRRALRSETCGPVSDIVFLIQDYRSIWGLNLDAYQVHMRYILLDTATGYRSQYHSLSTLVTI